MSTKALLTAINLMERRIQELSYYANLYDLYDLTDNERARDASQERKELQDAISKIKVMAERELAPAAVCAPAFEDANT